MDAPTGTRTKLDNWSAQPKQKKKVNQLMFLLAIPGWGK